VTALIDLLPAVFRIRDEERGGPLRALLDVIAEQVGVMEDDLQRLDDDLFIETCAPWVVPYIGDLLGITGLPAPPLSSRAEVAHTIGYRRRKGTAAMLEQLARDVTGLEARADESFELLCATQYLNHLRPAAQSLLSVRDAGRLEQLGTAFERVADRPTLCHIADVRRIERGRGRYNIPDVALFLWRLRAQRLTRSPAVPDASLPLRWFRFDPLGRDVPLFNLPRTEAAAAHVAEPLDVPEPISRRALDAAFGEYYGAGLALLVERPPDVEVTDVVACDLSDWAHAPAGHVALDPMLGRLAFPSDEAAPPLVTFHYGFAGALGGGEYDRELSDEPPVLQASNFASLQDALDALPGSGGVVEIADSGRYAEPLHLDAANRRVTLRARTGARPTLLPPGPVHLSGGAGDSATLDGLLIAGADVVADAGLGRLTVRHCTLASSALQVPAACELAIDHSIVGPITAHVDARVSAISSIVDAGSDKALAYAEAPLRLDGVTVFGRVESELLEYVSDSILTGIVTARRRQEGCVRFSYVPPGSLTPRRYRSLPVREADGARVRPVFTSTVHGDPGYAQLSMRTPEEIRTGSEAQSELGAFRDASLPRREAHLRARLDEYLRFGLEAGIFHAT
jgi:hypothetical protein